MRSVHAPPVRHARRLAGVLTIALLAASCGDTGDAGTPATTTEDTLEGTVPYHDLDDLPTVGTGDQESDPVAGGFGERTETEGDDG